MENLICHNGIQYMKTFCKHSCSKVISISDIYNDTKMNFSSTPFLIDLIEIIYRLFRHLLWAFTASPYQPGLKQFILQPKQPYQIVNFRFVDWHFYCKTKSKTLRIASITLRIQKFKVNTMLNAFEK